MKAFFTILVLIFTIPICSQDFSCQKSIYVEIGGSAGVGSINYESIFAATGKTEFLWRFGLSGLPIDKNNGFVIIIPATVGALIGGNKHKLELGFGQGFSITTRGNPFALTTPIIGYRYQNPAKPIYFRVTYTPIISYIYDFQYQNWTGISVGYNLNLNK